MKRFILTTFLLTFVICGCRKNNDNNTEDNGVENTPVENQETTQLVDRHGNPIDPQSLLPREIGKKVDTFSDALVSPDRRMAYTAAIAAVQINSLERFKNDELVMPTLDELIRLTGVRNLFVISHDNNIHNQAIAFCRKYGYVYNGATTAAGALKELRYSAARDLILLDSGLNLTDVDGRPAEPGKEFPSIIKTAPKDHEKPRQAVFARQVFLDIHKDVRTSHIPVVILAASEANNSEITVATAKNIYGDGAHDFVPKPMDPNMLKAICDRTFHNEETTPDAKREAERLVIDACKAVKNLKGKRTIHDVTTLQDALIAAFREPREGETARVVPLRVAAIEAAEATNVQKAINHLHAVAANTSNVDAVRAAALKAIGTLCTNNDGEIPHGMPRNEMISMLSERMLEESDDIWIHAAGALGQINLSTEERTELAIAHRINRQRKY